MRKKNQIFSKKSQKKEEEKQKQKEEEKNENKYLRLKLSSSAMPFWYPRILVYWLYSLWTTK